MRYEAEGNRFVGIEGEQTIWVEPCACHKSTMAGPARIRDSQYYWLIEA